VKRIKIWRLSVVFGEETLASRAIGAKVICRSSNEGVNCGIVKMADETGVILSPCRRLWWHKPADSSMAWYEGVAMSGLSDDSKVSPVVTEKVIIENYSLTYCTDNSYRNIMEKKSENS
jgi:hypothetical protein